MTKSAARVFADYKLAGKIRRRPPVHGYGAIANDRTKLLARFVERGAHRNLFLCEQDGVYRGILSGHHRHWGAGGNSNQPRLQALGESGRKPDVPRLLFYVDHQRSVGHPVTLRRRLILA
jgi:hypothetical protein